ncbi:MAG TPA: TfuA-like protein [Polyangiaceae bacterium LLY-WYZ-15_(1-7)]|nr:hypothetical protein [Myxococcales bacterium]MAT27369.1 hypothetical protein [Sandaracinus sp.]MBJ72495.1 hypothetical protein [Sandaracinus sp.]HJL09942.1 TfuA-like protein [Polyangiaceae bacterium LLY-WYZ-15_(1-7)]
MFGAAERPVVFAGPSLPRSLRRGVDAEWRPPMRRGDADRLLERAPGRVLILDGLFSSHLAVTPTECRALLRAGWSVVGAASMGALRASECWSEGMVGVGAVHAGYRLGTLTSDGEVAVGYDEACARELTVSLVHLRATLGRELEAGRLAEAEARARFAEARALHFLERTPGRCLERWREAGASLEGARRLARELQTHRHDPKRRGAALALSLVTGSDALWPAGGLLGSGEDLDVLAGSPDLAADRPALVVAPGAVEEEVVR